MRRTIGLGGVIDERQRRLGREGEEIGGDEVHFVDLAAFWLAKSTLGSYRVRFVDLASAGGVKSTKCTLPSPPSMPQLTFVGVRRRARRPGAAAR
jgi:hypothetical protein